MRVRRQVWLLFAGLGLVVAASPGCGRRDTVALQAPGGGGEMPYDHRWEQLSLLDQGQDVHHVAWKAGATRGETRAVAVGEDGLVLRFDGRTWYRQRLERTVALQAAVVDPDGQFWIVGDAGTVLREDGPDWRAEDPGVTADLEHIGLYGGRLHIAGQDGVLLRRDTTGWRDLAPPPGVTAMSLAVAADTLFITDTEGSAWGLADGAWNELDWRPWGAETDVALTVAADGMLYALSDSLHRRGQDGWSTLPVPGWPSLFSGSRELRATGALIWGRDFRDVFRFDVFAGTGSVVWLERRYFDSLAVSEDGAALTTTESGTIVWYDAEGRSEVDPAGHLSHAEWYGLAADPGLIASDAGYLSVTETGPRVVASLRVDENGLGVIPQALFGRDRGEFYVAEGRSLQHYLGGNWSTMAIWDQEEAIQELERDSLGRFVALADGYLKRWNGETWTDVQYSPFRRFWHRLHRGAAGDLLVWDRENVHLEREGAWVFLREFREVYTVLQRASGEILILGRDDDVLSGRSRDVLAVTRPGAGRFKLYWGAEVGVVAGRDISGGSDRGGEILVWSEDPVVVYRLTALGSIVDWELVAGPLEGSNSGLERLPDGSLVALGSGNRIFIHREY